MRQLVQRQRLFQVDLHQRDDLGQRGMRGGHAHRRGHALLVLVVAHMSDGELVGDQGDDAGADRFPHQVQHHVQRRGATRAGDAVAVDHEQVLRQAALGEFALQHHQVFPV
ncbi:hypothetical protein D3C71_1259730 [compost metagenome]